MRRTSRPRSACDAHMEIAAAKHAKRPSCINLECCRNRR
jgi:hypothetical protein